MRDHVESALSGQLLALLGHEAGVIGPGIFRIGHHRRGHGHFEIELGLYPGAQKLDIAFLNMAPVLAQMDGDAFRAGPFGQKRGFHGVGNINAACLPQSGDVIDVDAETNHLRAPTSARISSAISLAMASICFSSSPSSMTRASISVPE